MTVAEALHTLEKLGELVGKFPELAGSVAGIADAVRQKKDPTPAVKHAQRLAAEKFLGI